MSIAAIGWLLAQGVLEGGFRTAAIIIVMVMLAFLAAAAGAILLRFHLLGTIPSALDEFFRIQYPEFNAPENEQIETDPLAVLLGYRWLRSFLELETSQ